MPEITAVKHFPGSITSAWPINMILGEQTECLQRAAARGGRSHRHRVLMVLGDGAKCLDARCHGTARSGGKYLSGSEIAQNKPSRVLEVAAGWDGTHMAKRRGGKR